MKLHYIKIDRNSGQVEVVDHNNSLEGVFTFQEFKEEVGVDIPSDLNNLNYEPDRNLFTYQLNDGEIIKIENPNKYPFMKIISKHFDHAKQVVEDRKKLAVSKDMESWGNFLTGYESIESEDEY